MPPHVLKHFQKNDPQLAAVVDELPAFEVLSVTLTANTLFAQLCREIIGQQLGGAVADVIYARFVTLTGQPLTVTAVLSFPDNALRQVGMSWGKVKAIKALAQTIDAGNLYLEKLPFLSEKEIVQALTNVPGIGPWTAEMFLLFSLGKEDVFSPGDYGLRKAIQKIYQLPTLPSPKEAEDLAQKWSPYRSWACRILWKSLDKKAQP